MQLKLINVIVARCDDHRLHVNCNCNLEIQLIYVSVLKMCPHGKRLPIIKLSEIHSARDSKKNDVHLREVSALRGLIV